MNKIKAVLKQLQFDKLVVAFLLGAVLFVTTACNTGNEVGARPNNPPVQMGGQNNPYKAGGDGYTQYKASPDPKINRTSDRTNNRTNNQANNQASDRASLGQPFDQLIATNHQSNGSDGLLYPGSREAKSARSVDDFVSPERKAQLQDPGQIPAQRQPVFDRSDPNAKLLEKVGQTFKDASRFVREGEPVSGDQGVHGIQGS